MSFGISVSKSGSFAEALEGEVERVTDRVYGDHCEYLPPEKISRTQIEGLVSEILTFSRGSRSEKQFQDWNQVKSKSLARRGSSGKKQNSQNNQKGQQNSRFGGSSNEKVKGSSGRFTNYNQKAAGSNHGSA